MFRRVAFVALALASCACAADESRNYVVRLDLDKIAAQTAEADTSPGFDALNR